MLYVVDQPRNVARGVAFDGAVAAALGAISCLLVVGVVDEPAKRAVAVALAIVHVAPIAIRRRAPIAALTVMGATAALTVPLEVPLVVLGPAALVGVYSVGALAEPRRGRQAFVVLLAVMAGVVTANGMDLGTIASNAIALGAAFWLGDRSRRAAIDVEHQKLVAAEAARHAAAAERLRIARELHDVVAHAMSVIAVQAGTGRFVIDESPEVARDALATIETTSRDALQEMRRLLSVLRDDDVEPNALSPTPTLRDVSALIDVTEASGTRVALQINGTVTALPSGLDLCAYRVVQEALTNVRKHAAAKHVSVTVTYAPTALELEVVDDGKGPAPHATGGHGHLGMRERVGLYGGDLSVGARTGGGYRVAAVFPLAGAS